MVLNSIVNKIRIKYKKSKNFSFFVYLEKLYPKKNLELEL